MCSAFRQAIATLLVVVAAGAAMDVAVIRSHQVKGAARADDPRVLRVPLQSAALAATPETSSDELRVCADPNNMPFSNERGEGFENALAELVAKDLGRTVRYIWWPQRRGFIRNTLAAGKCDVVMGVPATYELAEPTRPYYRSTYVFVTRADRNLRITSFDDPRLKHLSIGIHTIGDDYNNVPPAQMLAFRGLVNNVRGYSIYGDYSKPDPPRDLIDAVARGEVDVAIAWGPLAGYFARREPVPLAVHPLQQDGGPQSPERLGLPMTFDISMAVRPGASELEAALNGVIARRKKEIAALLSRFDVPLVSSRPAREVAASRSKE